MHRLLALFSLLVGTCCVYGFVTPSPGQPLLSSRPTKQWELPKTKSHGLVLYMGWGPEPIWSTATIQSKEDANESGECVSVTIDVSPETIQQYQVPGQYVQLRLEEDSKPWFLAIASPPEENTSLEFLIKNPDKQLMVGRDIEISQVLGNGFPLEQAIQESNQLSNLLLFGAGSGIAPLKAALESKSFLDGLRSSSIDTTATNSNLLGRLYYGVRTADDLCFVDSFEQWERNGLEVIPVLSQPGSNWKGRTGRVQNCLADDGVKKPDQVAALLCGMESMTESVRQVLTQAGVPSERILTNY